MVFFLDFVIFFAFLVFLGCVLALSGLKKASLEWQNPRKWAPCTLGEEASGSF